jgi:uncharacterized membrane protein YfcA
MEVEIVLIGYVAALLMGGTLGVIGGGGSILTVPILVYLFEVSPVNATAYSLFIVGLTGLVGAIGYIRAGTIDYRATWIFGIPSLVGVFLTRRFLMPSLPETIWSAARFSLSKELFIMLVFALVMLTAAIPMIRRRARSDPNPSLGGSAENDAAASRRHSIGPLAAIEGLVVGAITGFVGAGGGFLIIPTLVLLLRLPVKTAIGTSLLIIAIKSLLGFSGDLLGSLVIDWSLLFRFSALSIGGILLGVVFSRRIPGARLQSAFGWFILATGSCILLKELFF